MTEVPVRRERSREEASTRLLPPRQGVSEPAEHRDGLSFDAHAVARRVIKAVIVIEVALLVGDYVFNFADVFGSIEVRRIFNIAREQSIPTWFASTQALALAVTAWGLSRFARRDGDRWGRRGWLGVSVFFLYVSIDDAARIHERVGAALEEAFGSASWVADYPSFAWQLFVAPILALGLLASAIFIWRRAASAAARVLVVAGLAGFAIAQGIDFLEGVENLFFDWSLAWGRDEYTVSHGFRAAEEMLEMLSTTALWAPLLWLLADRVAGTPIVARPRVP